MSFDSILNSSLHKLCKRFDLTGLKLWNYTISTRFLGSLLDFQNFEGTGRYDSVVHTFTVRLYGNLTHYKKYGGTVGSEWLGKTLSDKNVHCE